MFDWYKVSVHQRQGRFITIGFLLALILLLIQPVSSRHEAEEAPFADTIGLSCNSRNDCGFLPGLACRQGVCEYCLQDTDCTTSGKLRRCRPIQRFNDTTSAFYTLQGLDSNNQVVPASYCVEKDLFDPFITSDLIATILAFLSTALGSGCGVGGGGLLVPAYIVVIGLSPKHAIPLSKATIFGNAVVIYWFNFRRTHPLKRHVPIINYTIASIMEPTTLIGSIFGVLMNHVFPNWFILLLLLSLLIYTVKRTIQKGNKLHNLESQQRTDQGCEYDWKVAARHWLDITRRHRKIRLLRIVDEQDFKTLPPLYKTSSKVVNEKTHLQDKTMNGDDSAWEIVRLSLERKDSTIFPLRPILTLTAAWLIVLFQVLLRGGHGVPSIIGIECNSTAYWGLTIIPLGILLLITWSIGQQLRLENRLRVYSNYPFLESDIHWTWENVTKIPLYCITAGITAGLLGLGGGMVQGPLMLEMGILPPIQSATGSFMILYTASSTTLQFAIAGQFPGTLQYDYVLWFAMVGCLGGLCGQYIVAYVVKKYKRQSIVVYLLAITIGLSAISMGYIGLRTTFHDVEKGVHLGFSSVCSG